MFENPQIYLIFAGLSTALYWAMPRELPRVRGGTLIAFSAVAIFLASPLALALCAGATVVVFVTVVGMNFASRVVVLWAGIVAIVGLLFVSEMFLVHRTVFSTIGLSYVTLKSISVMVDYWEAGKDAERPRLFDTFLLNVFFPIFSAGPIERLPTFLSGNMAKRFDYRQLIGGLSRIVLGLFKTAFLSAQIINPFIESRFPDLALQPGVYGASAFYAYILLKFLALYVNFSGYTDIAVGTGRLYGLEVMENFRFPFLATNIQNFWQRWHLSLGNFVSRYMFMWLVRLTKGSVELSLVIAFVLVGLWHEFSAVYIIWGLLHGCGLALVARLNRLSPRHRALRTLRSNLVYASAARVVTILFTAWVHAFANSGGIRQGWNVTRGLIGL